MRSSSRADTSIDPNLLELIERLPTGTVEAVIRLDGPPPPQVRLVSRFGDFATCRLRVPDILDVHDHASVRSLKASRPVIPDLVAESDAGPRIASDERRPPDMTATGRGVVVGVVDWGPDPHHPDFLDGDGRTRVRLVWDQRGRHPHSPHPWGYGRVLTRDRIAAHQEDLGASSQLGSHGTHVMSIAAGNGGGGGPMGMAPDAELVFVHLDKGRSTGVGNLGDSVRILEAIDFVFRSAGERPVVVNLSVGSQGGSHDGESAVELALDAALTERPGRAIVQSTGNYFSARAHAEERLRPGETWILGWHVFSGDPTPNELEVWYPGADELALRLVAPDGFPVARFRLGERGPISVKGREVGRAYHRRHDPNNGDHLINCFLDTKAPPGRWRVELEAVDVVDGRCRAWIERDLPHPRAQSVFDAAQASPFGTTGTIANGRRTIAVGAYDPHSPDEPMAGFSSAGPTRDGRQKPDLVAPGVATLAARSGGRAGPGALTRKSGTSMAAPVVTGTVACMFEVASRPLTISETRAILLGSTTARRQDQVLRVGSGRLDALAAVEAAAGAFR